MSPTQPITNQGPLTGLAAALASNPLAETPRGGAEFGFSGTTAGTNSPTNTSQSGQPDQFAGMGPVLEDDDAQVFKQVDGLVLRQEFLAKNHLAQDLFYECRVGGYPWSELKHDTSRDLYTFSLPYGAKTTTIQAVPNKDLDLVNKTATTLLADFPQADAEPIDDTEEAESAADMANRFLAESASEKGTNDAVIFDDRVKRALACASSYIEGWVDPTGGGYVPLQIKAHPEAEDPNAPLTGPDGTPTSEYVLRYVTQAPSEGPDGSLMFPPGTQFTTDAAQAAPQWQPAIQASLWGREHIRVFPEDQPVDKADKVIILGYTTISRAKKRWPAVANMAPDDLNTLCDWTPTRYLVLLPSFQRARWKSTDGKDKEKAGSSDERIFFYYRLLAKAQPDYPKGADVVVSGAMGGLVIDRKLLATEVEVNNGQTPTKELRCREIPVVQVTPRGDPMGRDPSGLAFLEMFTGATENTATLAMGFSEGLDKALHTPFAVNQTSPIEGWQVDDARASGDFLLMRTPDDKPQQLNPPVLPTSFFEMYTLADEAINSIAAQERAAQGADNSKERSGKALSIAIARNNVANSGMQTAVNNAVARWNRIKLELAMAEFTTPQLIKYEGEDGAYKEDEFTGVDFALVGNVSIKAGTGTMMTPDQKVETLGSLRANGMMSDDEVKEAARPTFSKLLGIAPDPHEQYVERCIDSWMKGPPESDPTPDPMTGQPKPTWQAQYQQWKQANDQYKQAMAAFQQQTQLYQQGLQWRAIASGGPPNALLGPEGQNAQAMDAYQQASIMLQSQPVPTTPPVAPQPPMVPKPWTPFTARPHDNTPMLALIWTRKLERVLSGVKYESFIPEWQDVLNEWYNAERQAAAIGSAAAPQPQQAPQHGRQPTQPIQPQHPTQAVHAAA